MTTPRRRAKLSRVHRLVVTVKYDRPVTRSQARNAGAKALVDLRADANCLPHPQLPTGRVIEGVVSRVTHSGRTGR